MNLKAKIHLERQKAAAQQELGAHLILLREKGVEESKIQRNATVRHLKARVAKANYRLARVAAQEKLNQDRQQTKIEKPAGQNGAPQQREKKSEKAKRAGQQGKAIEETD